MKFLGIPISGMMYAMNWLLTTAQIELIVSDVSVVDYNTNDMKKKKKGEFDNTPASTESIKKANEEWTEKYGSGEDAGKGLSIGDIFGGGGMTANTGIKLQ